MGYIVRLRRKDGVGLGRQEYLCFLDRYNDGGVFTKTHLRQATVFESKEEIFEKGAQSYFDKKNFDYIIEEVKNNQ